MYVYVKEMKKRVEWHFLKYEGIKSVHNNMEDLDFVY